MNPVERENLEVGQLYYIESLTHDDDDNENLIRNPNFEKMAGTFKGTNLVNTWVVPWYQVIFDWFPVSKLKDIKNINNLGNIIENTVRLNMLWRFYKVEKYKIQTDMECRAVNLVLQKIIVKDQWFHYYW
jgi:hypothetical protein